MGMLSYKYMKQIPVGKGKSALVDDDDFEWVSRWRWHLNPQGYAVRKVYIDGRKAGSYTVFMHRLIAVTPQHMDTDHINGKPLDNQKQNLRICSNNENARNRKIYVNNTSGYKGVHWLKYAWCARIGVGGKRKHIGMYPTPELAALAYNEAAVKYHGRFARLNEVVK